MTSSFFTAMRDLRAELDQAVMDRAALLEVVATAAEAMRAGHADPEEIAEILEAIFFTISRRTEGSGR